MKMMVNHFDGTIQLLNILLGKCGKLLSMYSAAHEEQIRASNAEYEKKSAWGRFWSTPSHVDNTGFSVYLKWPIHQFKEDARMLRSMITKMENIRLEVDNTFILSDDEVDVIAKYLNLDLAEEKATLESRINQSITTIK